MKIYKKTRLCVVLACFVWSWSSLMASATWWLLTVPAPQPTQQTRNTKGAKAYCNSLKFLSEKQKQLCIYHPTIMSKISDGVKVGIRECEYQFQNQRWNCTQYPSTKPKQHIFDPVLRNKGPERAYIKAILSAAVSYTITRACSGGDLPEECMCAPIRRKADRDSRQEFEWGGCSDDVRIGDQFSRDFFDDKKRKLSAVELLDLHNNDAGRQAVRLNNKTTCRCHGLTGTCTQNICWRSLPPMRKVGHELFQRYSTAVRVRIKKSRVQAASKSSRSKLSSRNLVYLKKAPSFCTKNLKKGSFGTIGRWCNATSTNSEGCSHMCCNRGYKTESVLKSIKCNCKFHWCCNLTCETCEEMREESYCR
ncbi:protein Wnt-2b-A-like isoform X2 [Styela clava]|uniref:protein Wnt-2b-A-like isoform X2 n=1 Tax=Styela clava TaxID=7725 RepID=UPI001939DE79|nr:protein Wnt-2b-A-like isoform X2 [Styela clava]